MTTIVVVRPGETPQDALRRLEKLPADEYATVMGSEAGQALLEALRREAEAQRRKAGQ